MIKKGLKVMFLAGKDKKKEGEVIEIDRSNNRAKVKEINMVKKHIKTTKEKKGGIISKESFIHISNLKLVDNKKQTKKMRLKNNDTKIKRNIFKRNSTCIKNSIWVKKYLYGSKN